MTNQQAEVLFMAGVSLLVFLVVFLVIRTFVLWYFKIPRRIELLEKQCNQQVKIIEELREIKYLMGGQVDTTPPDEEQETQAA